MNACWKIIIYMIVYENERKISPAVTEKVREKLMNRDEIEAGLSEKIIFVIYESSRMLSRSGEPCLKQSPCTY